MSHTYRAVGWNPQKRAYDRTAGAAVLATMAIIAGGTAWLQPQATAETIVLRALGGTAFLLLHVILSIGPLCRLDTRLLPLLYNRRHLGVLMFTLAASHGGLALVQFHAWSDTHPLVSVLTTSTGWLTIERFPFQILGLVALAILTVMAATSHDFWLRTLTAPVWKTLHMSVYVAYACLVLHVAFGALQTELPSAMGGVTLAGLAWIAGLHTVAAGREARVDRADRPAASGMVDACAVTDLRDRRGRVVSAGGERVAVFLYDGQVSAVSNVCQHQNGPLGEGRIVGGCIVCPWHGFEYRPDTGASPPPFTEAVPTFRVAVRDGRVWIDPRPLPPGTPVPPARVA
jgi:sulfoxide reductase heme-binding subunit YedZ